MEDNQYKMVYGEQTASMVKLGAGVQATGNFGSVCAMQLGVGTNHGKVEIPKAPLRKLYEQQSG